MHMRQCKAGQWSRHSVAHWNIQLPWALPGTLHTRKMRRFQHRPIQKSRLLLWARVQQPLLHRSLQWNALRLRTTNWLEAPCHRSSGSKDLPNYCRSNLEPNQSIPKAKARPDSCLTASIRSKVSKALGLEPRLKSPNLQKCRCRGDSERQSNSHIQ